MFLTLFSKYMSTENKKIRFEFIDGLRGIAALFVILFHLNYAIRTHDPDAFNFYIAELFNWGYLGIQIFFVLSGFVIAYSLRHAQFTPQFLLQFFIKRSIRLDPPYWIIILLTLVIAAGAHLTFKSDQDFPFTFLQTFYNLIYLPDLMQVTLILPVAWTLCIEFQFYVFFAVLSMWLQRWNIQKPNRCIIWGSLFLFSLLQNTPWAVLPTKPLFFIRFWYSFFLGCLVCWTMTHHTSKKLFLIACVMVAFCSIWTNTPHAIVSLGIAILIYIVSEKNSLHTLLRGRFFQYMGSISYSLYLLHWIIGMKFIDGAYKLLGPNVEGTLIASFLLITAIALIIILSDQFYKYIEKPSLEYSKKLYLKKISSIYVPD